MNLYRSLEGIQARFVSGVALLSFKSGTRSGEGMVSRDGVLCSSISVTCSPGVNLGLPEPQVHQLVIDVSREKSSWVKPEIRENH